MPRGADEITQHRNVGAVSTDAPGVHRESQTLGLVQVHTGVVQLRQTETLRRPHAIQARRIDRPGWAVMPPGAARQLVILLPIAFVPSRHCFSSRPGHAPGSTCSLIRYIHLVGCTTCREGSDDSRSASCHQWKTPVVSGLFIYFIELSIS